MFQSYERDVNLSPACVYHLNNCNVINYPRWEAAVRVDFIRLGNTPVPLRQTM
jgi:hypothetical protein